MEYLKRILFIDIETVPCKPDYNLLTERMQVEWVRKSKTFKVADGEVTDPVILFSERAGIFSEFAKVVCIGLGSFYTHEQGWKIKLKSLVNDDETSLLKDFYELITRFSGRFPDFKFCGHNIKEFDIPFLCRRMVINNVSLPECMQLSGKKPWDVNHLDTLELWRFGDNKNYATLSLLAEVLGIPSPKSDIDGSQVGNVYWNENDLPRIGAYCLQDVLTTAKVYLRLKGHHDFTFETAYDRIV